MLLDVFLEINIGHLFQGQDMVDGVPVFELYQSGVYSKSLIYLRLDDHLLPAV